MKIVIIGGGLTGLSLTHWLHKQNHEVVLLEATDSLGGRFRGMETSDSLFVAPSETASATIEWLKSLSPLGFSVREVEHQPLFFESAEWKSFLGFGDFPSDVVDELSFYNQPKQWVIEPGLEQITRSLIENLPVEAKTMSEVTGFEIVDGRVQSVTINANEKITGDHFIFTPSPLLLNQLTEGDVIKPAHRTKIAKQTAWTAVTMALKHKTPIEATNEIRFVLGSGKEFLPVVGKVWPTHSVWMNLVSSDTQEDLEHVGDCVRFIKRTLKRVWPELVEQTLEEKIRIRPQAYGKMDLKLKEGNVFPELPNLSLADARLSEIGGDLATVAVGMRLAGKDPSLFVAQPQNSVLIDPEAN
jgi:hypothetical protein